MAVAFETTTSLKKYAIGLAVSIYIDRRRFISPARPRYPKRSSLLHAPLFPWGAHARLERIAGQARRSKTYIPHCSLCPLLLPPRGRARQRFGGLGRRWSGLNGEDDRAKEVVLRAAGTGSSCQRCNEHFARKAGPRGPD